jgi:hypothetical protein
MPSQMLQRYTPLMSDRLKRLTSQVDASVSDNTVNQWLYSKERDKKLLALLTIRQKVEDCFIPAPIYFETAKEFLTDNDNDCKWQSFIIVGEFVESKPNECWEIITKLGDSNNDDTRAAVATVLLEHYFEKNPKLFDTKFREYKRLVKEGHKNLLRTLSICRSDWGSDTNHSKVDRYLEKRNCGV